MGKFVNRDEELTFVEDAVDTLCERKRLLRTPIIEFYGADGIGKTALLKKVQEKCNGKPLRCIWEDQSTSYRFVRTPHELLKETHPVVILLDSLDAADEDQLQEIEVGLRDLTESSNLFIVLTTRKMERFSATRSLARKLKVIPLSSLNRENCEEYFDSAERDITLEIRDVIYEWTRGYPLAMDVMVNAILDKNLDPSKEQDRKQLISILINKVIYGSILSRSNDYARDQTLSSILSVPRRFNLAIMQKLIETFAKEYEYKDKLAYITLPDKINQVTNALSWSMRRGGYSVDEPIRNIFLLQLKSTQPQKFLQINMFLAQLNEQLAKEVAGPDRVRYLREYFYHLANSGGITDIPVILTERMHQLIQEESVDSFIQFYEEFSQDDELKEVLGDNTKIVLSFLHSHLAKRYRELAEKASELHKVDYLRNFFFHIQHDPEIKDFSSFFEQEMRQIKQEIPSDIYVQLVNELFQNEGFKILLKNIDNFS